MKPASTPLAKWAATAFAVVAFGCARSPSPASKPPVADAPTPSPPRALDDVPDAADAPVGAPVDALRSAVTKVTVYSDRARVTREAQVEVSDEPRVFAFTGLPGWVDDASVRVAASAGRIVDVRVDRSFLASSTDESRKRAEATHERLVGRIAALNDEIAVLDAQKAQIESIKAFSLEKIGKDTTIGNVSVESYGDVVTFISDALRDTAKSRREVQRKLDDVLPEFEASQKTLTEMDGLLQLEETRVEVTLQSSRTAPSTLQLTYMMPGATWEPMHELRASTEHPEEVEVLSFAVVTQTSGEDWEGAELAFSTQSSTEAVRIPELDALVLGETHRATRIVESKMSSFTRAQQAFEGQNELWNKVHHSSSVSSISSERFEEVYQSNFASLQVVQSKTVQLFDTLQQRGTTDHFRALSAPRVRGNGHSVRMRIGNSKLASAHRVIAAPEQSLNAARSLEMTNTSGQSMLPGKVNLYQDGEFLGVTEVDFIADGESFAVFSSVADRLKLSRTLDRKQSSVLQRGKRNKMKVSFVVAVENLSEHEETLQLNDRIPVSENKAIKVERVKITGGAKPDAKGLVRWEMTLAPKERRELRISYEVEYPAQLVIDARRRRDTEPKPAGSPRMKRKAYRVDDALMGIEELL